MKAQLTKFYQNNRVGYINNLGDTLVTSQYDFGGDFYEGRALIIKNGKRGFINEEGKVVIPLIYDDAGSFHNGTAQIVLNGLHGFITNDGVILIQPKYDFADTFSVSGLARVQTGGLFYFINKEGRITTKGYLQANNFNEGLASVFDSGKWGFINTSEEWVILPQFDYAFCFFNGKCSVVKEKLGFFIDKKGQYLTDQLQRDKLEETR